MTEVNLKEVTIAKESQKELFLRVQITRKETWKGLNKKLAKQWNENAIICEVKGSEYEPVNESEMLEEVDTVGKKYVFSHEKALKTRTNGKPSQDKC